MKQEVVLEKSFGTALFLEAIQKEPFGTLARNANLDFCADGVEFPTDDQTSIDRYIKECSKQQIIPFSQIRLKRNWGWTLKNCGLFVPETSIFNPDTPSPLSGGKIHRVIADLCAGRHKLSDVAGWFINNYLTALGSKNYILNRGSVYLDHDGDLSESHNTNLHSYLFFALREAKATISLETGSAVRTQWKIDQFNQWFNELIQQPEVQPVNT